MNMKTNSVPGGGASAPVTDAERGRRPDSSGVDTRDKSRFDEMYAKPDGRRGKDSGGEGGEGGSGLGQERVDMSSLFQNRLAGSEKSAPAQPLQAEAIQAPAVPTGLDVEKLVDRILVSDPAHSADNEVRLMLNDSLLADTEIVLKRSNDGLLSIHISTSNADSLQTLAAARNDLHQALNAVEEREVRLEISGGESSSSSNDADDRDRRSRGYMFNPDEDA
jgi:type III secretion system needle length determinant